jgi:O-antigen/teichoic acid export membrane protein
MSEGTNETIPRVRRNALFVFGSEGFSRLLGALFHVLLVRYLVDEMEVYGQFSFALGVVAMVGVFSDLGLATLVTREVSRRREDPWPSLAPALAARFALSVALGLAALVFVTVADRTALLLTAVLAAAQVIQGQGEVLTAAWRGRERMGFPAFLALASRTGLYGTGIAAMACGATIEFVVMLYVVWAIPVPVALRLFMAGDAGPRLRLCARDIAAAVRRALPIGIGLALWVAYFRMDLVLLGSLAGGRETAVYAAPFRVVEAILFLPTPVLTAVFPVLASRSRDDPELRRVFKRTVLLLTGVGIAAGACLAIDPYRIVQTLFGRWYVKFGSEYVLEILAVSIPLSFAAGPFLTWLVARHRERTYAWIMGWAAAANLVLDAILIPGYGADGAAAATVLVQLSVTALAIYAWSRRGRADTPRPSPSPSDPT